MELDEHFKKMLNGISERIGNDTKVIIVSSGDDINSSACYPTRPYKLKHMLRPFPNLFMAPDPCIVDINGVQVAITSTDIAQHLSDSEYCV
jgi:DNA polymerase alpha subunit B